MSGNYRFLREIFLGVIAGPVDFYLSASIFLW
jgi:hypothetical protein